MIESIQHLRAVAALGVVVFHVLGLLEKQFGVSMPYRDLGQAGVDLFFIISGFIMWVTAVDRDESPLAFAKKRILRIVPLYWVMTTIILVIVVIQPDLMRTASHDVAHFAASYFFIAWQHPTVDRMWPPLIPGWTLNYEMFFYVIVTLSLCVTRTWRLPLIAGVLITLPILGFALEPSQGLLAFYTSPILLEFLFGVLIGDWFTSGHRMPGWGVMLVALLTFFSVGLFGDEQNRVLPWGAPLALLVIGSLGAPALLWGKARALSKLIGDSSYSLYLVQFIVLAPLAKALGSTLGMPITGVLLVVTAVIAGLLCYFLIEKMLTNSVKRATLCVERLGRHDRRIRQAG